MKTNDSYQKTIEEMRAKMDEMQQNKLDQNEKVLDFILWFLIQEYSIDEQKFRVLLDKYNASLDENETVDLDDLK